VTLNAALHHKFKQSTNSIEPNAASQSLNN